MNTTKNRKESGVLNISLNTWEYHVEQTEEKTITF